MAEVGPNSKNADVKAYAKNKYQISTTGTKEQVLARIALAKQCCDGDTPLKLPSGDNPIRLKGAALKKQAAQLGCNVMGTVDEILSELVGILKKAADAETKTKEPTGPSKFASTGVDPIKLGKKVLELAEVDDNLGILNLGGAGITKDSPVAKMRKCYLKLSLVLHPDKNRGFPEATLAFQALVSAFDRLTKPELFEDTSDIPAAQTLSRSNANCHQTSVKCPRCNVGWGSKVEGNPDYYFNFMMMGLRTFNCSTCLIEFGCMTAIHSCPKCRKQFEYSPEDFHRQITCGNAKCDKKFGFHMYHASNRVMKDLRVDVKEKQEKYLKTVAQKKRRAESSRRRGQLSQGEQEEAFVLGLTDACPRCGAELSEFDSEEEQRDHLRTCTDANAHKRHEKKKIQLEETKRAQENKQTAQEDVQAQAAWQFLGGAQEQMWMLTDGALDSELKKAGIDSKGDNKYEKMAKLGQTRPGGMDSGLMSIEQGKGSSAKSSGKAKRRKMTADSVPSNFQQMTMDQLKGVCAAHGNMGPLKHTSKADVIAAIEKEIYSEVAPLMLAAAEEPAKKKAKTTAATKTKAKHTKVTMKAYDSDIESDDTSDDDPIWEPEE